MDHRRDSMTETFSTVDETPIEEPVGTETIPRFLHTESP
jgi:hypothetical protein